MRNIGPQITSHDLGLAFGRIGDVRDVYIPRDYHSQQSKGFAFIEYADPERESNNRSCLVLGVFIGFTLCLPCFLRAFLMSCAHVLFSTVFFVFSEAREARDEMDRFRIKGCELEVVFAQERRKSPNEMRGRVVNQQNHGGGGRNNRDRSSSFERHQRRRRDSNNNKDRNNNDNGEKKMDSSDENDGEKKEQSPVAKDGEE